MFHARVAHPAIVLLRALHHALAALTRRLVLATDCKFTLLGLAKPLTVQTAPVANTQNPEWPSTLKLGLPAGFTGGEMRVRVWDDDVTKDDDAIGSTVVAIEPGGSTCKLTCKGRELAGTAGYVLPDFEVSFAYTIA